MKDLITVKVYLPIGHLQPNNLNNSEFASSLYEREHLAKIFGKLPSHMKASGCILKSYLLNTGYLSDQCSCCFEGWTSSLPSG
jgi:hypothetical protein